jgi:hypothetical protein
MQMQQMSEVLVKLIGGTICDLSTDNIQEDDYIQVLYHIKKHAYRFLIDEIERNPIIIVNIIQSSTAEDMVVPSMYEKDFNELPEIYNAVAHGQEITPAIMKRITANFFDRYVKEVEQGLAVKLQ